MKRKKIKLNGYYINFFIIHIVMIINYLILQESAMGFNFLFSGLLYGQFVFLYLIFEKAPFYFEFV